MNRPYTLLEKDCFIASLNFINEVFSLKRVIRIKSRGAEFNYNHGKTQKCNPKSNLSAIRGDYELEFKSNNVLLTTEIMLISFKKYRRWGFSFFKYLLVFVKLEFKFFHILATHSNRNVEMWDGVLSLTEQRFRGNWWSNKNCVAFCSPVRLCVQDNSP